MTHFSNAINQFLLNNTFKNITNLRNIINIDYSKYIENKSNTYDKILLDRQTQFETFLFIWYPNIKTQIHNHSKNGCIMKVLDGKLVETLYDNNLNVISYNSILKDNITYINDSIGYHSIENGDFISASIHIYSPINQKTKYFK